MLDPSTILPNNYQAVGESQLNPQQIETISRIVTETVCSLLSNKNITSKLLKSNTVNKSIGEASREYVDYLRGTGYSKKYQESVKATLKKAINFFNENTHLINITTKQIEEFVIFLKKDLPKGYRVHYRNLKACFSRFIAWDLIIENPFMNVKLPKCQKEETTYITRDGLEQVISNTSHPVMKEIFLFAFLTALRLSEITHLKWNDVKLSDGIIGIGSNEFNTKSRKVRHIPVVDELIILLKNKSKIMSIDGYVFSKSDGKKYSNDFVSKSFKRAVRKTSIDRSIHFHSLRHSGISYMLNKGVPVNVVKQIAGHSSIAVTNIYSHTNLHELRNAIQVLNNKNDFNKAEGYHGRC